MATEEVKRISRTQVKKERNEKQHEHRPHATARYLRIATRKCKSVVDTIRGKSVDEAEALLMYNPRVAAAPVLKLLNSAIANAENNMNLNRENLFVAEIYANQGPTLKRYRPRAQGRASRIHKRTSHITIVLDEREPVEQKAKKANKTEKVEA